MAAWRDARDHYEEALGEEMPLEPAREVLFAAEQTLTVALRPLVEQLVSSCNQVSTLVGALRVGVAGLLEVSEHAALDAERTARHGELAAATHDERERRECLDLAGEALDALDEAAHEAEASLAQLSCSSPRS